MAVVAFTTGLILLAALPLVFSMFFAKKWSPKGLHCYVTGGSSGLGLALALLLTRRGAHVSIVARDEKKLKTALAELEKARQNPDQKLNSYSFSLNEADASTAALDAASAPHGGRTPDVIFLCAGTATPGFFVEQTEVSLRKAMDSAYWVQAWSALAASKRMVREGVKGKIVFTSSILAYFSMVGYSSYSPGKHALRGLAETLRSEMQLYGITIHLFCPGTIYSPGYEEENKTKPEITLKIEEADSGLQPEQVADALIAGIERNDFHIAADFLGNIFRASTRGGTPQNNVLVDTFFALVGWVGLPIWRKGVDALIIAHGKERHVEYLKERNFFD
ncbi:Protein kinase domain-containing protein [Mycena indigotica]|uniref:3-dehydrosphinganine reductase n=1 Tax=Mycena indigotica TaxID=2126181 RepID=A0A8H6W162_9AGAR|nr:Protein kinase domain-containing protein [Mycena indigotica]KAF7301724.1 Protein kinase domain-containing protein [Mycena indigotica]